MVSIVLCSKLLEALKEDMMQRYKDTKNFCLIKSERKSGFFVVFTTQTKINIDIMLLPTGQIHVCGIFVEHSHEIFQVYSEKVPNKVPVNIPNVLRILNVLGILIIGIFPDRSMNILRILHVFFLGGSRNIIAVFSRG